MFLHHTMTDAEILRSCEGCTSQHLRLVADRLRERIDQLRRINDIANGAYVEVISGMDEIAGLSKTDY